MGTLDAHLVALDAKDGKVLWDKEVADPAFGYSITHAPLIIGDNVIVGVSGGEYGIRGHVTAYNAMTGDQVWRWYSIPAPKGDSDLRRQGPERLVRHLGPQDAGRRRPAPRHRQGEGRQRQVRRRLEDRRRRRVDDAGVRQGVATRIFVAVGNPSPDLDGSVRPGDNLYTDCVVAIDATIGKTKWYYQTVPHDVWDLDAVSPPVVATRGRQEGRRARRQDRLGLRARRGHRQAGPQERRLRAAGEHVRPAHATKGTRMLPGANGGAEWSPIAIDPTLNYAFVAALHQPMNYIVAHRPVREGPALAGLGVRGHPGRGAVRPLLGRRPQDRQDRLAEQGAPADDGRRAGHRRRPHLHR